MSPCDRHFYSSGEALGHQGTNVELVRPARILTAGPPSFCWAGIWHALHYQSKQRRYVVALRSNHQVVMHGCRAAVRATFCRRTPYIFSRNWHPYSMS